MPIQVDSGDIIAAIALLLSGYSIKKTNDFNKRQNEFIETNEKLNKILLEKETQDCIDKSKANISASFITLGSSKKRLKIFNKGSATARNIKLEFKDGKELFFENDLQRKLPIPILEQLQAVELLVASHCQSPSRVRIVLSWEDDFSLENIKELTPTMV